MSTESAAFKATVAAQQGAANPEISAFVSANAGSGKTRVLTNRVARLLLQDTPPQKILCITFTKAAAAEMSDRLFKLLGEWALADDEVLRKNLDELEGSKHKTRSPEELDRARTLFARALETPGGLKIQTIHSFCESVLKRFPLEAGVPPGFKVIEESESRDLAERAIDEVAHAATNGDQALQKAFETLAPLVAPDTLPDLILNISLYKRAYFEKLLAGSTGWTDLADQVRRRLDLDQSFSEETLINEILNTHKDETFKYWHTILNEAGGNPQKRATTLSSLFVANTAEEKWLSLKNTFLTNKNTAYSSSQITTKAVKKLDPSVVDSIEVFKLQVEDTQEKMTALKVVAATNAIFSICERVSEIYRKRKLNRAVLDFDDLIIHSRALLTQATMTEWVMFKLDQGIDHILLDEAQDTSPDAWSVVDSLLSEFFAGSGAREKDRTFFAVGDQKQSIYSFQGADALLFNAQKIDLGKKISAANAAFEDFPLSLSFRTTEPVLKFVDAAFADEKVLQNVSSERTLSHGIYRDGAAGIVELWPLTPKASKEEIDPWDAPLDTINAADPIAQLTSTVSTKIKKWLMEGEKLESKDRAIEPRDIMILFQARSGVYHEMIKALGRDGVPVAGPDKMSLLDDQGVLDLMSFAQAVLLEPDDLSLAETLKSPFFNFDDEALFNLGFNRGNNTLWATLKKSAESNADHSAALEDLEKARRIAANEGPFAFFNWILDYGTPTGRERLTARLTEATLEPINEFLRQALDFEANNPRSLQSFVSSILKQDGVINRDSDQAANTVRVMTVHKSKGLESPIVFILDADRVPDAGKIGKILDLTNEQGEPTPALAGIGSIETNHSREAKSLELKRRHDEYRRLFYVAATRAEDHLYIAGVANSKKSKQQSWFDLGEAAFDRLGTQISKSGELWAQDVRCLQSKQTAEVKKELIAPKRETTPLPKALITRAAIEMEPRRLSPSHLADDVEHNNPDAVKASAYSPIDANGALFRGNILHRLLEVLPDIALAEREATAKRLIDRLVHNADEADKASWLNEVFAVLNNPEFAEAFSKKSLAEVPIVGRPKAMGKNTTISGQIDRLVVEDNRILAIDYKTNRPPPRDPKDAPLAYLAQMAAYRALLEEIYPDRPVNCAILWTYEARLMPLPAKLLDDAFKRTLS